jgi:hypothetical protein
VEETEEMSRGMDSLGGTPSIQLPDTRTDATSIGGVRIVNLTLKLRLAVPSLMISSIPQDAIGFSFEAGTFGGAVGVAVLGASLLIGAVFYPLVGALSFVISLWLLGSTGTVMLYNSITGLAFVKPLCTGCHLLPIIQEHEAFHLSGVGSDAMIWNSVRSKYTRDGLSFGNDSRICPFCPIPKRLSGH